MLTTTESGAFDVVVDDVEVVVDVDIVFGSVSLEVCDDVDDDDDDDDADE